MALPELITNTSTPGTITPLGTLTAEIKNEAGALTLELSAELPAALQGPGQCRLTVGSEIMLVKAAAGTKLTILERAVEGSAKAAHVLGTAVYFFPTAEALELYVQGLIGPWKRPVALATTAALPANTVSGETIVSTGKENLEVDGNKIALEQRILVKNQAESKNDGIYEVIKKGGAAELWELKRTTDANTRTELQDATVAVEKGTKNEGCDFNQVATVTTVGVTAQTWVPDGTGPWVKPESESAALEKSTIEMRLENNGSTVRMRGKFTAKEAFTSEKLLFTSKALYRPPGESTWVVAANASTGGAGVLQVETNGEVLWKSSEVGKGSVVTLNVTYDLT